VKPCALCHGQQETWLKFEVWKQVFVWEHLSLPSHIQASNLNSIVEWWKMATKALLKEKKRDFNGVVIYSLCPEI
jgi:hypothetical protein